MYESIFIKADRFTPQFAKAMPDDVKIPVEVTDENGNVTKKDVKFVQVKTAFSYVIGLYDFKQKKISRMGVRRKGLDAEIYQDYDSAKKNGVQDRDILTLLKGIKQHLGKNDDFKRYYNNNKDLQEAIQTVFPNELLNVIDGNKPKPDSTKSRLSKEEQRKHIMMSTIHFGLTEENDDAVTYNLDDEEKKKIELKFEDQIYDEKEKEEALFQPENPVQSTQNGGGVPQDGSTNVPAVIVVVGGLGAAGYAAKTLMLQNAAKEGEEATEDGKEGEKEDKKYDFDLDLK